MAEQLRLPCSYTLGGLFELVSLLGASLTEDVNSIYRSQPAGDSPRHQALQWRVEPLPLCMQSRLLLCLQMECFLQQHCKQTSICVLYVGFNALQLSGNYNCKYTVHMKSNICLARFIVVGDAPHTLLLRNRDLVH